MTNEEYLTNFLEYLFNKGYTKSTINGYRFGVKNFLDYIEKKETKIKKIRNKNIEFYKKSLLGIGSDQTINTKLFAIKRFIEYLNEINILNVAWKTTIIKIKNKKDTIIINKKSLNVLIRNINKLNKNKKTRQRDKLLIMLLYYSGCRTKKLLNLKKDEIKHDGIVVNGTKIYLDNYLLEMLKKYAKEIPSTDYLFYSHSPNKKDIKRPLTEKSVQNFFNKYKRTINKNLSINDLRNSYVANVYYSYLEYDIQKINTHKEISKNNNYLTHFKFSLK